MCYKSSSMLQVREVGDGNINYVYIVEAPSGAVVLKQGLPYLRIAHDWPLTQVCMPSVTEFLPCCCAASCSTAPHALVPLTCKGLYFSNAQHPSRHLEASGRNTDATSCQYERARFEVDSKHANQPRYMLAGKSTL